jgi:hypothetical protein
LETRLTQWVGKLEILRKALDLNVGDSRYALDTNVGDSRYALDTYVGDSRYTLDTHVGDSRNALVTQRIKSWLRGNVTGMFGVLSVFGRSIKGMIRLQPEQVWTCNVTRHHRSLLSPSLH